MVYSPFYILYSLALIRLTQPLLRRLMETVQVSKRPPSFWQKHWQKLLAAFFWLVMAGAYLYYTSSNDLDPLSLEAIRPVIDFLAGNRWGPLVFIGLYILRPLVLFSALVLSIVAGALFGPVWGIVYTIIGSNGGAGLAYFVGGLLGQDVIEPETDGEAKGIQRYVRRMRENIFETVLTMRLVGVPYDLVSYLAGFLKVNFWAFILATALGALPGTIAIVLFGASVGLEGGRPSLDWRVLLASVAIFAVSIAASRLLKRRENTEVEPREGESHA